MNKNNLINKEGFFRYAMKVEYLGSLYAGSQKQPEQRTIQSELEAALAILIKQETKTVFSGRTDSGVHSKGQIVHFDSPFKIDTYRFLYSLNSLLPQDISISIIKETDSEFHSQKSALSRWYRYIINNRPQRSVWLKQSVQIQKKLNIKEMNKALSYLTGKNDFSSFKSSNSKNPASECIMYFAKCKSKAGIIIIDFVANRFLYNMVRIIVGTLINIGKGVFPADHMLEVLNFKDRTKAGTTAKADGLIFMFVDYGEKYNSQIYNGFNNFVNKINKEAVYNENIFCKAL
ncbi:MAG: tRNA pseudouridine(38-40) synthase TruA [bacterium]